MTCPSCGWAGVRDTFIGHECELCGLDWPWGET